MLCCAAGAFKIQLSRGIPLKGLSDHARRSPQNSASQLVSSRRGSTRLSCCAKASRHTFRYSFISPKSIHLFLLRKNKLFRPDFLIFCNTFRLKKQNTPVLEKQETGMAGFYVLKNHTFTPMLAMTLVLLLANI